LPFSPLEQAVMQALGWDLRDVAPDLAGQFEESLPGVRRNTGAGLYTEMIIDPQRPPPDRTPTGSFGTVHAMVGDLPGSMAFKVKLREGVLLGLEGEAFDMNTFGIDFRTTPFDRVFTVDDQGRSIAFDSAVLFKPSPLLELQTWQTPDPGDLVDPDLAPRLVNVGALQRVQDPPRDGYAAPSRRELALPHFKPEQLRLIAILAAALMIAFVALVVFFPKLLLIPIAIIIIVGRLGYSRWFLSPWSWLFPGPRRR
jgi:hypothetical protein